MAAISTNNPGARTQLNNAQLASFILIAAVVVTILQWSNLLPAALHRLPEEWIPPFANWMDTGFNFIRYTLGLETLTRWFAEGPLQFLLDTTANILLENVGGLILNPSLGPVLRLLLLSLGITLAGGGYQFWQAGHLCGPPLLANGK